MHWALAGNRVNVKWIFAQFRRIQYIAPESVRSLVSRYLHVAGVLIYISLLANVNGQHYMFAFALLCLCWGFSAFH